MQYTRLGTTGLKVSRLALGCMSYGDPATPGGHPWALTEDQAEPFFRQAVELGITFWDTANVYQRGTSEEIVGRAITRYSRREDIVLATKVRGVMHDGPGGSGLSRKRPTSADGPGSYRCRTSTTCSAGTTNAAPIVGATKPHHLSEAVAALDIHLTDDEAATLEKPYVEYGPSWY